MVFKLKQPPQGPRRRMSAREVAKDVGVNTDKVMAALAELGEYVPSAASKLEEPVVRRLYEALDRQYTSEVSKAPPPWDWKGQVDQGSATAEASAGRGEGDRSSDGDRSSWHSPPRGNWWETQNDVAPAWELESWKIFNFAETERDAWLAHGLRPGQVQDAARFRDAGLQPADLVKEIKGWTALKRLRAGEPPEDVVQLLRASSEDERAG